MQAQVARLREEVANEFKAQMQVSSLQIVARFYHDFQILARLQINNGRALNLHYLSTTG